MKEGETFTTVQQSRFMKRFYDRFSDKADMFYVSSNGKDYKPYIAGGESKETFLKLMKESKVVDVLPCFTKENLMECAKERGFITNKNATLKQLFDLFVY